MPTKHELKTILALAGTDVVHVSEVTDANRALCRCARCDARLVPHRGDVYRHHFKHRVACACDGGQETALHLLAKDAFLRRATLALPAYSVELPFRGSTRSRTFQGPVTTGFDSVELERRMPGFTPDALAARGGRPLAVEFANTHASGTEKAARLAAAGLPAVEVDISNPPLDAGREGLEDWVLHRAPRSWLWHSRGPGWRAGFRAELDAEATRDAGRLAASERQEAQRRREEARWKGARAAMAAERGTAIRRALSDVPRDPAVNRVDPAVMAWLTDNLLDRLVGVRVRGSAHFPVDEVVWQCAVMGMVVMAAADGAATSPGLRPASVVDRLAGAGHLPVALMRMDPESEAVARALDPDFAPPSGAVQAYLGFLVDRGLLAPVTRDGLGFVRSSRAQVEAVRRGEARRRGAG